MPLQKIGITSLNLEEYLGHSCASIAPVELGDLRGIYRSIKDGDATWQQFVEPDDESEEDAKERVTKATAAKTEDLVAKLAKTKPPAQVERDHMSAQFARSRKTTPMRPASPTQEEKAYISQELSKEPGEGLGPAGGQYALPKSPPPPPLPVTNKLCAEDSLVISKFTSLIDIVGKNRAAEYFRKEHDCTMPEVTKNIPRMKAILTDTQNFISTVDLFISTQKKTAKPKDQLLS